MAESTQQAAVAAAPASTPPNPYVACANRCGADHDIAASDRCPSCARNLCRQCQAPNTACIPWLEREGLGDALTNTCAACGAVGCAECLRQCSWGHEDVKGEPASAPMLCGACADARGVVRVPCDDHYWFICTEEHDFGDENWCSEGGSSSDDSYDGGYRGDMTTYCSICGANANYCAKMQ